MKPRIFVSSTFYDLKFIREDLSNFIKAHDFEPIMFEDGDIGYTPGKELDSSCYDTMKNADMVLLIIGGEYGSPATDEVKDEFKEYLSVTRKEFRTAVSAGIPIFVFIDTNVYSEYGVYEVNYENIEKKGIKIEFKATKNINIFRFIREIRNLSDKPIQEFRRSADIKSFLSKQWSDMFKNYLVLLRTNAENASLQSTVSDMDALIKQMSIMLDAVGKKVIGDNDTQYKDIVKRQNTVEVNKVTKIISNGVKVGASPSDNRKNNVMLLLSLIRNTYNACKTSLPNEDPESNLFIEYLGNNFIDQIHQSKFHFIEASYSFISSIPKISNALDEPDIEKRVITRLQLSQYYENIFWFPVKKHNTKDSNE